MTRGSEPAVSVENLACVAGDRLLFRDMSWTLDAGEALIVRGANGSGKSSLLKIIAGLRRAAAGSAALSMPAHYLGHALGLKTRLTGREHLAFWRSLYRSEKIAIPDQIAPFVDLPVNALSRGQAQQLALARFSIERRAIWLLDEPTGPLDDKAARTFERSVADHLATGGAALIATHRELDVDGTVRELWIAP